MNSNAKTSNLIKTIVIICDFLVLNVLLYVYIHFGKSLMDFAIDGDDSILVFAANAGMLFAQYFFSTIVHERRSTSEQVLRQVTLLVLLFGVLTFVFQILLFQYEGLSFLGFRFAGILTPAVYVGILLSRYYERWIIKRYRMMGRNRRDVVFIGSDPLTVDAYRFLVGNQFMGYHVKGYYSDYRLDECPEGLEYCGTIADFEKLMDANGGTAIADEIYCSLPVGEERKIRRIMRYCNNNVAHFYYIPSFSQIFGHTVKFEHLGKTIVFTNYEEPLTNPTNRFVKRTFDLLVASIILLCLLPFIPIIALIIKLQSPGPIFFKQSRTGLNGREFQCYKFRSMHVNKDADLVQATEHDPRKFAFGNFMRKANIDELPQFLNVLKGDMSIVGPRPHMLHHTEVYRELIDKYMVRHFVKPGITGWAQVTGYRGETRELWQMEGRVQRDIWYIENWSIWLDLRIIGKTALQIIIHDKNAY